MYVQLYLESMCFVNLFRKYLLKFYMKLDVLWQRLVEVFLEESIVWYCSFLLGKNILVCLMFEIFKKVKLFCIYINYLIRVIIIIVLD